MVLPPYDVEVFRCCIVSSLGAVYMDGRGFFQVFLIPLSQVPGYLPYVFFIAGEFPTLADSFHFLVYMILMFGFN